jgi:hypothetical protein
MVTERPYSFINRTGFQYVLNSVFEPSSGFSRAE